MVSESAAPHFNIEPTSNPTPADHRADLIANPAFGRIFTDHMAVVKYSESRGWHDARITARKPISLDPAASVLHYAQEIFEGMKAYRTGNGSIVTFRPEENAKRFRASAARMAMADLPQEIFIQAVDELVKMDRDWVPEGEGKSLYLRPFMIATEAFLGVKPASEYLFVVIACPVGAYFGSGCVSVWVSEDYTRAAPGGTGAAKCGGNYAASLVAQRDSQSHGCDQVLFLDSREQRFVEEMGGMNVMFLRDDNTLVTPPLTGTILPGITRDAILQLAKDHGLKIEQTPIEIDEVFAGAASGRYREAFACGTAAVITPIGSLRRRQGEAVFGDGKTPGDVSLGLKKTLTEIQSGKTNDVHGWIHSIV
ncbi:branched-chain amino acid aminotransferase [Asaia prunellae]|uniref:branched-chain amino acid aminotransferase n=1 Tax=Asaia prunellae TaxID=610245 RepID=UPI00046F5C35|nr:branched-chain amino acid aminotransferase [Asaia prunellae]